MNLPERHLLRLAAAMDASPMRPAAMEVLHGATIAPLTALTQGTPGTFDGGVYYADGSICDRARHLKNGLLNEPARERPKSCAHMAGLHVFGGMLKNEHFGHFMAESLARIWAAPLLGKLASVAFFPRMNNQPVPRYIYDAFALLLPSTPLTVITQPTSFDALVVPDQLAHPTIGFASGHEATRLAMRPLREVPPLGSQRVYVSRSKLQTEGGIVCEQAIEQNLVASGYSVIHPQEMTIEQQIAAYNAAQDIIFAEGSALHLFALVARPEQKIAIIRRRPLGVVFDWQLASFGASLVQMPACIERFWIPASDGSGLGRARAEIKLDILRERLLRAGMIRDEPWMHPSIDDIARDIGEAEALFRQPLVAHPYFEMYL